MEAGKPSYTAEALGWFRAAHQVLDHEPLVLRDPMALSIMGSSARDEIMNSLDYHRLPTILGARGIAVTRARFCEDHLEAALAGGLNQYVLLGAGLDTFAFRQPEHSGHLKIWEVDHPDTQGWKLEKIREGNITVPPNVVFVPVDFETDDLRACLEEAGLDTGRPAFFSWMGVSYYLDLEDIRKTFRLVGTMVTGTQIALDFILDPATLDEAGRQQLDALSENAARRGEPVKSTFAPAKIAAELRAAGFSRVEHLDTAAARSRYLENRTDDIVLDGAAEFVFAEV